MPIIRMTVANGAPTSTLHLRGVVDNTRIPVTFVLTPDAWQRLLLHTNGFLQNVITRAVKLSHHAPDLTDATTAVSAGVGEATLHIARWHVREALRELWGPTAPMRFTLIDPAYNIPPCPADQHPMYQPSSSGCPATPIQPQWICVNNNHTAAQRMSCSSFTRTNQAEDSLHNSTNNGVAPEHVIVKQHADDKKDAAILTRTMIETSASLEEPLLFGVNAASIVTGSEVHSDKQTNCVAEQQQLLREFHELFMYASADDELDAEIEWRCRNRETLMLDLLQWLRDQSMSIQTLGLVVDLAQRYVSMSHIPEATVLRVLMTILEKLKIHVKQFSPLPLETTLEQLLQLSWVRLTEVTEGGVLRNESILRVWTELVIGLLTISGDVCRNTCADVAKQLVHRLTQSTHVTSSSGVDTMLRPWLLLCLYHIRQEPWMSSHIPPSLHLLLQQVEREVTKGVNVEDVQITA